MKKQGFTLIEVLVVVLIIGILAAIALPKYQKAVNKSRFTDLMPITKAMAEANEEYYLRNGIYTSHISDLAITGQEEYPEGTTLRFGTNMEYAYVLASNTNVKNNYIIYQKNSRKFANNVHCEAEEGNDIAQELCISLGGQIISGSITDGYTTYVLSGAVGDDKLPSSLSKVAKKLCGDNADCDYEIDPENNTITIKDCVSLNSSTQEGERCQTHIYDETEALLHTGYHHQYCSIPEGNANYLTKNYTCSEHQMLDGKTTLSADTKCVAYYAKVENGQCVPYWKGQIYYQKNTIENGVSLTSTNTCQQYQDGVCTKDLVNKNQLLADGNRLTTRAYCVGTGTSDSTCNQYDASGGVTYTKKDASGNYTGSWQCSGTGNVNTSNGNCLVVSTSAYWRDYSGSTKVSETTVSYSGNNATFTTKDASGNVINTVSCTTDKADYQTGTCN